MHPAILLDRWLEPRMKKVSAWVQEHANISKYWLALGTMMAGLAIMGSGYLFNFIVALMWFVLINDIIRWLYRKDRDNSDDCGEVLRQKYMSGSQGHRWVFPQPRQVC